MSSIRWKVLWNTSAQIIGRLVGAGTTFVVSLVIARAFGAEGYGDFAKVTTFVALFYLLADFGMNAVYLQKDNASWGELLGVRLAGSALLMFLALSILVFLPQGMGQGYTAGVRLGIIVFLPTILFQAVITTTNAAFQKRLRYTHATVAIIAGSVVTIGAVWILAHIGVLGALVGIGAGSLVTAAAALLLVRNHGETMRLAVTKTSLKSYFTRSLPLGLTLLFNLIYFRADHFILTLTRSTAEVGIYGLAYKVFEFPLAIPTFFMNSVYPIMLTRQEEMKNLLKKSCIVLSLTSVILSLAAWFGAPLLSMIRPEFAESVAPLRVLSLGLPFFFLTALTMWTLIALKKHVVLAMIYGASMALNVFLNAWLVPMYGYMAAAWVTVVSEGLVFISSVVVVRRSV